MWEFKGEYTGGAKAYMQEQVKKELKIVILSIIASVIVYIPFIIYVSGEDTVFALIASFSVLFFVTVALALIYQFYYKKKLRNPKSEVKITNDGVQYLEGGFKRSMAFYKLAPIEYHDDFIVFAKKIVIQENIMVEGDWDELLALLKNIEESLETEDPIYQLGDPDTEFFNATVKSKRVFKRFDGVQLVHSTFEYYATFILENGEEREYQLNQEIFEKIQEEQTGVLVLISGIFFSFGDGEDIE